MTTNKEIMEKLRTIMVQNNSILKLVGAINEKITAVPADEPKDSGAAAAMEGIVEGGREEPDGVGIVTGLTDKGWDKKPKTIMMLQPGDKNVKFAGDVEDIGNIYTGKAKSGNDYRYQRFTIMDNTGNIIITLWDSEIDKYAFVRKGDYVLVDAWEISMYKTTKQAKLGKYGKIVLGEKEKHRL